MSKVKKKEELSARVRESEEQIARGEVYSQEESDRMFDEYLKTELGDAPSLAGNLY